jgi:hypothetical protein
MPDAEIIFKELLVFISCPAGTGNIVPLLIRLFGFALFLNCNSQSVFFPDVSGVGSAPLFQKLLTASSCKE